MGWGKGQHQKQKGLSSRQQRAFVTLLWPCPHASVKRWNLCNPYKCTGSSAATPSLPSSHWGSSARWVPIDARLQNDWGSTFWHVCWCSKYFPELSNNEQLADFVSPSVADLKVKKRGKEDSDTLVLLLMHLGRKTSRQQVSWVKIMKSTLNIGGEEGRRALFIPFFFQQCCSLFFLSSILKAQATRT